ncbi:MAG: transporter [Planctomycetota bacterium]
MYRPLLTTFAMLLVGVGASSNAHAQSGGVETLTGEMLFSGGNRLTINHRHTERSGLMMGSTSIADPANTSMTEDRTTLSFDHGISPRLTLTALMPYVQKTRESSGTTLSSDGIGDLAILAKFLLGHEYWSRSGWHLAMAAGVEAPTGETDVMDGGSLLSPGMQPGSGSWDPFVSFSANLELDRWRFDLITLYKNNRKGDQQFEAGDQLAVDLVGAYRFQHEQYPGPSANVKLGLLYRDQSQASQFDAPIANSGYDRWLGRVALAWHPQPQWDLSLSVDVPLSESYDGIQLAYDYSVSLTVGMRF